MQTLFISYNGTTDPLFHTQGAAYLRDLARHGVAVHVMTYERRMTPHRTERTYRRRQRAELARDGLQWHPLRYHKRPAVLSTAYDVVVGWVVATRLVRRHRITLLHARGTISALVAAPVARLTGCRWVLDLRGLVSQEYVDGGLWRRGSWIHRVARVVERLLIHQADAMVVLTRRAVETLRQDPWWRLPPRLSPSVIPCCVDVERFAQAAQRRDGMAGALVLGYVGSIGTWYLFEEMARFVLAVAARQPHSRFLVVSPARYHAQAWQAVRQFPGLEAQTRVVSAAPEEVPEQLASAHVGLALITPALSKQFSSPTKIGEYLASGIPVVVNRGVGDLEELVVRDRVGVVLHDLSAISYDDGARELLNLLSDRELVARCRRAAREHLSLERGRRQYLRLYTELTRAAEVRP
ncbi:MAG: glycosyltransferase [Candidatus Omnitrophica bacterium]|nr:glycosyltransferase [Candidatus Omnitrophota bacterium]